LLEDAKGHFNNARRSGDAKGHNSIRQASFAGKFGPRKTSQAAQPSRQARGATEASSFKPVKRNSTPRPIHSAPIDAATAAALFLLRIRLANSNPCNSNL